MTEPEKVEETAEEVTEEVSEEEGVEPELEFAPYEPYPAILDDGGVAFGDLPAFLEETSAIAAHLKEGQLWVLRAEELKWMKIEDVRKADAAAERKAAKEAEQEAKKEEQEKEADPPEDKAGAKVTAIRKKKSE